MELVKEESENLTRQVTNNNECAANPIAQMEKHNYLL